MSKPGGRLAKIAFKKRGGGYRGSVALGELSLLPGDPAAAMQAATGIYQTALSEIRRWQRETQAQRQTKQPLTARRAWELGDILHRLEIGLAWYSCRLDGPYDHLWRHAGTTRALIPYRTFRRHLNDPESIPSDLKWETIAKRAKAAAQSLASGGPVEG